MNSEKTSDSIHRKKKLAGAWTGLLLALFVLLMPGFAMGASIRAVVDQTRITPEETVGLTVTIDGGQGEIDTSAITDFTVVSRGTGTSVQIINGQTTRQTHANFVLIPLKSGTLTIPPLSVNIGEDLLKTREIKITVSPSSTQNTEQKELFVRSTVSNDTPYAGEQMIYTFQLFSAVRLANLRFQKPEFSGFTARQIGDSRTRQMVINGRQFDVTELEYLLVSATSGPRTIGPALLGCDVIQPGNRTRSGFDGFFNDPFFGSVNSKPAVLRTDPIPVSVKPLPENNSGDEFSGLVGQFQMTADLTHATIKTGDSTTLAVTITGRGNIMDAQGPVFNIPDGLKQYQDSPEEAMGLDSNGYSGSKTFRSALVAVTPGTYTLGPVRGVFFDPDKGRYRPLTAGPLELIVTPSGEAADAGADHLPASEAAVNIKKEMVSFTGHDILPLKEGLDALNSRKKLSFILFALYLLMPALVYLVSRLAIAVIQKDVTHRTRMLKKSEKALKQAGAPGVSMENFMDLLYRALVAAIFASADRPGEAITYEEAREILQVRGYPDEVVSQSVALLENIESAKYGLMNLDENLKKALLSQASQLIKGSLS